MAATGTYPLSWNDSVDVPKFRSGAVSTEAALAAPAHEVLASTMLGPVALHRGGAPPQFVLHDQVLRRMLPRWRAEMPVSKRP